MPPPDYRLTPAQLAAVIADNPNYQGSTSLEVIAGIRPDGSIVPVSVDDSGNFNITVGGGTVGATIQGQAKIATTGTAIQLPANALTQGVTIQANPNNTAALVVGGSGVTDVADGTGNGFVLPPGASIGLSVGNTDVIYVNGTANDLLSFIAY